MFLLDTDTFSLYQRQQARVVANVQLHKPSVTVSAVTVEEQALGWLKLLRKARTPQEIASAYELMADAVKTLAEFPILSMSVTAVDDFQHLRGLRLNVGSMDLRIASVARDLGATVVTRNQRDFGRVPGLAVVDWSV